MTKNLNIRMHEYIIAQLLQEGFDVFSAATPDTGSDLIIRHITEDGEPIYIELQILSRAQEAEIIFSPPIRLLDKNNYYFVILHSIGMKKMWLQTAAELQQLQSLGDDRESGPYLIKDFSRLKVPHLSLKEYKDWKHQNH